MEIEAVYLPGVVGEDRADGHAADDAVVQLRQRGRHPLLDCAAAAPKPRAPFGSPAPDAGVIGGALACAGDGGGGGDWRGGCW